MLSLLVGPFVLFLIMVACDGSDADPTPTQPPASPTAGATTPSGETPAPTATPEPGDELPTLTLEPLVSGLARPTFITHAGDGSGRLFVIEKPGFIRIIQDGDLLDEPFLDIRDIVDDEDNEKGLLGLAFHPDYESNGRFFVAYTTEDTNSVAEYAVTSDANVADPASGKVLIAIPDQYANHNGGMLAFGPNDGYLYISTGDGGSSGDPLDSGQSLDTLLGKILRIDVDSGDGYGIPGDNPFVGEAGAEEEIWAYGLRNPWRFSFDRETADLWIADVGQNRLEEVNFQSADSAGGENYGWRQMEGTDCFFPQSGCDTTGVPPIFEYDHGQGCSITGGYVYRGEAIAGLQGVYLFTDYCTGNFWATQQTGGEFETEEIGNIPGGVSAFGEDEAGELYVVNDPDGVVYRLVAE